MFDKNILEKMYNQALTTLKSIGVNELVTKFKRSVVVTVLLDDNGNLFTGVNIGWWHSTCSEHTALANFFLGKGKDVRVVLSLKKHHTRDEIFLTSPCGICRQMFAEMKFNPLFVVGKVDDEYILKQLSELLPYDS